MFLTYVSDAEEEEEIEMLLENYLQRYKSTPKTCLVLTSFFGLIVNMTRQLIRNIGTV